MKLSWACVNHWPLFKHITKNLFKKAHRCWNKVTRSATMQLVSIFLDSFPQHSVYPGHCESSNDAVLKNNETVWPRQGGLQVSMLASVKNKKGWKEMENYPIQTLVLLFMTGDSS